MSSPSPTGPPSSESAAAREADAEGETSPSPDRRHLAASELGAGLAGFRFRVQLGATALFPSSESSCLTSQLPSATAEPVPEAAGEDEEAVGPDPAAESLRSGERRRKSSTEKSAGQVEVEVVAVAGGAEAEIPERQAVVVREVEVRVEEAGRVVAEVEVGGGVEEGRLRHGRVSRRVQLFSLGFWAASIHGGAGADGTGGRSGVV